LCDKIPLIPIRKGNFMKKILSILLITAALLSLAACGTKTVPEAATEAAGTEEQKTQLSSAADITAEYLQAVTTPSHIVDTFGTHTLKQTYANTGNEMLDGAVMNTTFGPMGSHYEMSENISYEDGYVINTYMNNNPDEPYYYMSQTGGKEVTELESGYAEELFGCSFLGLDSSCTQIGEVKEEKGSYIVSAEQSYEGESASSYLFTIDRETGRVLRAEVSYGSSDGSVITMVCEYDYSGSAVDYTAKTENGGDSSSQQAGAASGGDGISFETLDIQGNAVSSEDYRDAKLIMLNFWEPWCKPCVGEMPDLQALYEKYKDQGLVILGVYSQLDMQEEAESIVDSKGISYPILQCNESLQELQKDYVPATYFMDGQGSLLEAEPYVGARSFEEWEEIIVGYLQS